MKRAMLLLAVLLAAGPAPAQEGVPDYDELLTAAHEHTRAGRHDEAVAALTKAIEVAETDEQRAGAIFTLAASHEARGNRPGSIDALKRALTVEGGGDWLVRCLQRLGQQAERDRDLDLARRAWARLVEVEGADAQEAAHALLALARIARQEGHQDDAAEYLRMVLAHDTQQPWHREARRSLVSVLIAQEAYDEALAIARDIEDESHRRRLMVQVADHSLEAGDTARAETIAHEVLRELPEYVPAMRIAYRAALGRDALDELRQKLIAETEGGSPEPALRFLAQIARWEGDAEGAVEHLRRLAEVRPDAAEVRLSLGQAALDADMLDEAEAALREALRLSPDHGGALSSLAEIAARGGRTDEAIDLLKQATGYDPADPGSVRSLIGALGRHSLHHAQVEAVERARERSGDEHLLAWELARAYTHLLRYEDATRELLAALEADAAPARAVGMELEQLVTDELAGDDVLAAVRGRIDSAGAPSDVERLALARVLLAVEDWEGATALLAEADGAGMEVASLAQEARLRGEDDLAASLYEMALGMAMPEARRVEVALRLARLQRERGAWQDALQTLEGMPALDAHPEALLIRAELLTERAHRLDEARDSWRQLLASAGGDARYVAAAREGMARWLLASGRLDEAEQAYAELAGGEPATRPWDDLPPLPPGLLLPGGLPMPELESAESAEPAHAVLMLAEIALRRGDLDEARERFRFVVVAHPQSDWANDALERLAFIRDNLDGEGGAEARYFEAVGLRDRGEHRTARDLLVEIAGTRGESLADDALAALAEIAAEQGDARTAADRWLSLAERFPDSMLAPRALLRAAGLLGDELEDPSAAAAALTRITEDYPDSAAAHEARSLLELLPPPRS